ncbi:MAG: hypothetical protein IPN76_16945 [Saprospiraceae bacterium]|nr:hypothetical protein [Saprospiraceae bacterium]
MKYHLPILFIAINFALFAQTDKGATPLPQSSIVHPKSSVTRAVVIGISDYQDKDIPDLRFADRDAETFLLKSSRSSGQPFFFKGEKTKKILPDNP